MNGTGFLCSALTSKGHRCINKAGDTGLCPSHDSHNWCGVETVRGEPCKRFAPLSGGPCAIHR